MAHLLNLNNKKTEFPNNLNEDVDSKQSHQDKNTSGSTTLDSKKMSSSEKSAQKKVPIIIPKLKIHSPLAMKIPISPRGLKSPKRNPEEKKQLPEKKEEFIDIEEIKKNFAEEWSAQNEQDLDVDNKKNDNSISTASEIIKKNESSVELNSASSNAHIPETFIMVRRATITFPSPRALNKNSRSDENEYFSSKISSSSSTFSTPPASPTAHRLSELEKKSVSINTSEASDMLYSSQKNKAIQTLVSILVKEATSNPITKKTVTTVGRQDCAIFVIHLPEILMPYVEKKFEKFLRSEILIQSLFSEDIKSGNAWKEFEKIYAEIKEKDSLISYEFGEGDPNKKAAARSMLKPFSDRIAGAFFGKNKHVLNFPLPKEIIDFLLISDHTFSQKLLDSSGTSKLSMDDIDKARFSFINNLLVTRLLQPLIISKLSKPATQLEIWFQSSILDSLQEAIITFSEDFFDVSFSKAPENLKNNAIKKIKDEEREKKEADLERAKARFSEMRLTSSRRHQRAVSEGVKTSDAMEEISKYKLREKALKDRMNKMKELYSMKHLPEALLRDIDSGYKQFMVSHQKINDNQILDYLKKIAISYKENEILANDVSMETVDEFIEKLKKAEDIEIHNNAIRRATRVTKNFDKGFLKEVFSGDATVPTDTSRTQESIIYSTSSSTSTTSSATPQTPGRLPNSEQNISAESNVMIEKSETTETTNEKGE